MLKNPSHGQMVAVWFIAIGIATLASLAFGAAATTGTWILLFLLSLLPPAISFMVWRGAPPATVAEVLYAAQRHDGR